MKTRQLAAKPFGDVSPKMIIKLHRILAFILSALCLSIELTRAATIPVNADITVDTTWSAANTYLLQSVVYVRNGATLTIEPGTVIRASTNAANLTPRDGIPNLVAALWIARGAKINAAGTAQQPIIFTIEGDDLNNPNDLPYNLSGQWGGLVLCGYARLNSANLAAGNAARPIYERFEGTTEDGTGQAHLFGGDNDDDNSGVLRYVSIRYPGSVFAPNRELNGLTLAAVGSETTIEYVEVFNSSDDAFEWWGGSVNTRYLVAAFAEDDDFDTDQGYRGNNQFWFGIKPPWAGSSDSRAFETDGDLNQSTVFEPPKSQWTVANATLIGRGQDATGFGGGIGWNSRDEAAPNVLNSIFTAFAAGVKVDDDGVNEFDFGQATLLNSIFSVPSGKGTSDANAAYLFTDAARMNTIVDPVLGGISYTNNAALDPRPQTGSPALTSVLDPPVGLAKTAYRGAFAPNASWADGWTALARGGFLKPAPQAPAGVVEVAADITVDTTWSAANTYLLQSVVYVRNGATLTIEPGTVIRASTNAATLLQRDGIPNLVAALWITRGAKINAAGTAQQPIIFTIEGDDLNNPNDLPYNLSGQWGGLVLCGNASLNSANLAAGNAATPIYERFEGTTEDGPGGAHLFGGDNDDDNSGVLRYVSIRYPGSVFAPNRELNGLTLAGVGRGTTVEYVEVLNSSDDAFEWWGGTVNTRYLVAAFAEDDDFDTDQGYRGNNQFWFGIKPPWAGSSDSRAFETDGDLNQNAAGELPKSQWTVANATLIGRGQDAAGFGGGIGWNARDEAAPNVLNSIFTAFAAGVKVDADGLAEFDSGQASLKNSIFGVPAGKGTSDANAAYLFTDAAHANTLADPMLGSISYTNKMMLDPRPTAASPALSGAGTVPNGLVQTGYRGAFAPDQNWAAGWTALSSYGVFVNIPDEPPAQPNIMGSIIASGSEFQLSFATEAGRSYQVQSTTDLGTQPIVWQNEGPEVTGTAGGTHNLTDMIQPGGKKFFRVIVH